MPGTDGNGGVIQLRVFVATIILLGLILAAAGSASYLIPAGHFEQTLSEGKNVPVYKPAARTPIPVWKIAMSPVLCLTGKNGAKVVVLVIFILAIGGSFSVMNKSGLLPGLLARLAERFRNRKPLFLVVNILVFSLLGSCLGLLEEITPMVLLFVPLAQRMGWNNITGLAIPFLSAGFGFAAATFNPFTVVTAQRLADVPPFSGVWLRAIVFVITTLMVIGYLVYYTKKLEKSGGPTSAGQAGGDGLSETTADSEHIPRMGAAIGFIAVCLVLVVVVVGAGAVVKPVQDLAFPLIALIFLVMGLGSGLVSGVGPGRVFGYFFKGLGDFAPAILLILMAAGVSYLIEIGNVMDTMLFRMSQKTAGMGPSAAAIGLYLVQMLTNVCVPSGTGQAFLTIPILAPLGDLIGVTRQTVVLAYQFGDGFSNLLWPTNPLLLIAIGLAGVSYREWIRFLWPLHLALFVLCCLFLLLAVQIGYA